MDLSHQLDAIHKLGILRSLNQPNQRRRPTTLEDSFEQFSSEEINLLFGTTSNSDPSHLDPFLSEYPTSAKSTSPHGQQQGVPNSRTDYFEQEDMFTPLISPAMTPSFTFQGQPKQNHPPSMPLDLSPLSSPAIMAHMDGHPHEREASSRSVSFDQYSNYMSAEQICEQYEQLELAKKMITRKLSALQRQQDQMPSSPPIADPVPERKLSESMQMPLSGNGPSPFSVTAPVSPPVDPMQLEPVTPASLMNLSNRSSSSTPCHKSSKPAAATVAPSISEPQSSRRRTLTIPRAARKESRPSPLKKQRRESAGATMNHHASPRALKPLLISPTLAPSPSDTVRLDAERILATRSNYQNLMEGKAAALGIAFSPHIKSGLEVRRTAHKAAEQKRRDSLKEWFDRLRREVEEGYVKQKAGLVAKVSREQQNEVEVASSSNKPSDSQEDEDAEANGLKPLSKVLLLRYAYEYISTLKETVEKGEDRIKKLEEENKQLKESKGQCTDKQ
ncbi:hypothetical protein EC973_003824 [Apophysomyces ossiformis]|uniref:BHLH domain-containing protein n=1 Tax=Apophysomyces ossiformis TaxID=679940 RepID=A0A8H7ERK9_9FUNG|nr:hypothetical protein EC973_003824 [Apophysomyces ossiformis]